MYIRVRSFVDFCCAYLLGTSGNGEFSFTNCLLHINNEFQNAISSGCCKIHDDNLGISYRLWLEAVIGFRSNDDGVF